MPPGGRVLFGRGMEIPPRILRRVLGPILRKPGYPGPDPGSGWPDLDPVRVWSWVTPEAARKPTPQNLRVNGPTRPGSPQGDTRIPPRAVDALLTRFLCEIRGVLRSARGTRSAGGISGTCGSVRGGGLFARSRTPHTPRTPNTHTRTPHAPHTHTTGNEACWGVWWETGNSAVTSNFHRSWQDLKNMLSHKHSLRVLTGPLCSLAHSLRSLARSRTCTCTCSCS